MAFIMDTELSMHSIAHVFGYKCRSGANAVGKMKNELHIPRLFCSLSNLSSIIVFVSNYSHIVGGSS